VNTINDASIRGNPYDLFVLAKDCQQMSPNSIRLSDLGEWFHHGCSNQGIYVGAHLYPDGAQFNSGHSIPSEIDLRPIPCYYNLRFECDGDGDNPLLDACERMSAVCRGFWKLRHFQFLGEHQFETHFRFFSTGRRSIYAVAGTCSARVAADWDIAAKALMQAINSAVGAEVVDLQIYNTPKAPARAYFTQHEKGTFFNPIPLEWVLAKDVPRIKQACAKSVSRDWTASLIETIGAQNLAGGPIYDALSKWTAIARFQGEARKASFLSRLPATNRPDYAALLAEQGQRISKTKRIGSTSYFVLEACPYCGKSGHAQVSEFGTLKCFADSCVASKKDGIGSTGDDGWMKKVGIVLEDSDADAGLNDDLEIDRYPNAVDMANGRNALEIRAEMPVVISRFLGEQS